MAFQHPSATELSSASMQVTTSALTPVEQTLLIPLAARAHGARLFPQMALHDSCAASALSKLEVEADDYLDDPLSIYGVLSRTRILRQIALDFFIRHPRGLAANLGCGLSCYFQWLDRGHNQWLDADLPTVIALRENLLPSLGQHHRNAVVDLRQTHWWRSLGLPEGPNAPAVLLLLEGVLMYLRPEEVRQILHEFAEHAPAGSEIVFDSLSWMATGWAAMHPLVSRTDAQFLWGARQMSDFTAAHPRLRLLSEHSVLDGYDAATAWLCPAFRALWGVPMYGIIRLGLAD